MMRTTLGGASSGKAGSIAAAGKEQGDYTKTDSEKVMKTDQKKKTVTEQILASPVRVPKKAGVGLFATPT